MLILYAPNLNYLQSRFIHQVHKIIIMPINPASAFAVIANNGYRFHVAVVMAVIGFDIKLAGHLVAYVQSLHHHEPQSLHRPGLMPL